MRSQRRRALWFIAVLLAMLGYTTVRNVIFFWGQRLLLAALPITLLAAGRAVVRLWMIKRAQRLRRTPPNWVWGLTGLLEVSLPTMVLVAWVHLRSVGTERALVYPVLGVYFIAILLSTLHLQPVLCLLSGIVVAVGYLGVVAYAYSLPRPDAVVAWLHASVPATFGVALAITRVLSAGVAGQFRRRLLTALAEADLRRRDALRSRDTLIFALAEMAETRDTDTGAHLERIAWFCGSPSASDSRSTTKRCSFRATSLIFTVSGVRIPFIT